MEISEADLDLARAIRVANRYSAGGYGQCRGTAALLAEEKGWDYIEGSYVDSGGRIISDHCWNIYKDLLIDVTYDQFIETDGDILIAGNDDIRRARYFPHPHAMGYAAATTGKARFLVEVTHVNNQIKNKVVCPISNDVFDVGYRLLLARYGPMVDVAQSIALILELGAKLKEQNWSTDYNYLPEDNLNYLFSGKEIDLLSCELNKRILRPDQYMELVKRGVVEVWDIPKNIQINHKQELFYARKAFELQALDLTLPTEERQALFDPAKIYRDVYKRARTLQKSTKEL